jgi:hypothetical protein
MTRREFLATSAGLAAAATIPGAVRQAPGIAFAYYVDTDRPDGYGVVFHAPTAAQLERQLAELLPLYPSLEPIPGAMFEPVHCVLDVG